MGIRDFGRFDIQFHFNGEALVLKVTKFSTCDDVIHMILYKIGLPVTKVIRYAVFEIIGSAERMLSGKTLVYKVWRSWGCENKHFQFHVKSKETKLGIRSNLCNKSAESDIDELFLDQYNRKAKTPKCHPSHSGRKSVSFNMEYDNAKDIPTPRQKETVSSGKQIVLARYLYDLFTRSAKKKCKRSISNRERADGAENEDFRCADGSASNGKTTSFSQHEKCSFLWNKYYATDSESESDDSFSDALSDDVFGAYCDETVTSTMDTAFLKSARDSDSDEGIDVTSVTSTDLDTAFIGDFETKCILNDCDRVEILHNGDTVSEESGNHIENELELNLSDDKVLKELFGKAGKETASSEDDEMDSFMRSRLDSF